MKNTKTKITIAVLLTAFMGSACSSKFEQFQQAFENPHQNEVEMTDFNHVVSFNGSSEVLSEDEKAALDYFLYSQGVGYGDILFVDVYGDDPSWGTKMDAINNFLKTRGLWAKQAVQTGNISDGSTAALVVNRYDVVTPDCTALSEEVFYVSHDFKFPIQGCITAHNLGVMVASPADLLEGRPDTLPEPFGAARAIQLYRENYGGDPAEDGAAESLLSALFGN